VTTDLILVWACVLTSLLWMDAQRSPLDRASLLVNWAAAGVFVIPIYLTIRACSWCLTAVGL